MPYGISSTLWAQMSPEDQNAVMQQYYASQGNTAAAASIPTIGGYVQPTQQQLNDAYARAGVTPPPPSSPPASGSGGSGGGSSAQNPSWVYAVNLPSTYPDFAAMKAAGAGLVIADDDPNFALLMDAAKQWGVQVAVNVTARAGESPAQYAAKVAQFRSYGVDKLVLDIEAPKYDAAGGYAWSTQAAALLQQAVGNTSVAVTMEPHQSNSDFNYSALQSIGGSNTQFWIQSYDGNMNEVDESYATAGARAAGVSNIVAIHGPNTSGSSGYVSYGVPQTGASAAGVYGTGPHTPAPPGTAPGPQNPANSPTHTPAPPGTVPGPQNPGNTTPLPPDPWDPASKNPPPPPASTPTPGSTPNTDWASAYFQGFGLPADVAAKVNDIFNQNPNVDQATQLALAYIRSTPWYANTFPGIAYGMQHGIITNEQDYRQYVTALDQYAMRYTGQHITSGQVTGYLQAGVSPDTVGKQFQGTATAQTYGEDWRYYLGNFGEGGGQPTQQDLQSLGEEQSGLDTTLGQKMQRALQNATARYQKAFEGVLATPSLSLGTTGLNAPSLAGTRAKPDIAA